MKQYQVWIMISLLAVVAGVMVYTNFKGEPGTDALPMPVTEE